MGVIVSIKIVLKSSQKGLYLPDIDHAITLWIRQTKLIVVPLIAGFWSAHEQWYSRAEANVIGTSE